MPAPDKTFIRDAFDSITPCYDMLNQVLSFGQADRWRKKACKILLEGTGSILDFKKGCLSPSDGLRGGQAPFPSEKEPVPKTLLDLGCGTGKFLECFLRRREQQVPASVTGAQGTGLRSRSWESVTGVDFSVAMLKKARETVSGNVMWLQEDFEALPFLESSFDLVISAFTLRSVQKLPEFLGQVHRILTPGGRAAFLDLTRPKNFWIRLFFFPYLRYVLPLLGWLLSGNRKAYAFLSGSIRSFQSPEDTIRLMQAAGYRDLMSKSFAFGAATLIIGKK